jgi:hypothetical protein
MQVLVFWQEPLSKSIVLRLIIIFWYQPKAYFIWVQNDWKYQVEGVGLDNNS